MANEKKMISAVLSILLLSGCTITPPYERPGIDAPEAWSTGEGLEAVPIPVEWWSGYGNENLNGLIKTALSNNNDLRAALARLDQARAGLKVAGAALIPSVDGSGSATHSRSFEKGETVETAQVWRAGLGVSYELDLFGANHAAVESARADLAGSEFDRKAVALVVASDVAKTYFNLLNLRERLNIADQNLGIANDILRVVQARFDAGATSALDLSRQKTILANDKALRASLVGQIAASENALSILLGQAPHMQDFPGDTLGPVTLPAIATGQPSTLLERRPDIGAAEAALQSANADIGAARAAFFPSINLGLDSAASWSPLSRAISLSSSLLAPIFSGGALDGNLESAKARQLELVESYRKTVLVSFQEVEDALANSRAATERHDSFTSALREAEKSYDLSRQLYDAGSIDFQTLLDAQQSLFSARDNAVSVKFEMLEASVDLYKALGGGWE